jgi:disulfide bond formation protein DsbB
MLLGLIWARARVTVLGLAALLALVNAQISLFHVGVEYHWWAGLPQCAAPLALTMEEIRQQIFASTVVPCDKAVWHLLGLSMAAWAGLLSLAQAAIALWGTRK